MDTRIPALWTQLHRALRAQTCSEATLTGRLRLNIVAPFRCGRLVNPTIAATLLLNVPLSLWALAF